MQRLDPILCRLAMGLSPAIVVLLAVAGCSGGDGETRSAASSTRAATSDADSSSARDRYDLRVAQCLRDKGFKVKDPQPGEGITEDTPGISAAGSACMAALGDPPIVTMSEADKTELLRTSLRWASCLRGLGYQVEEPKREQAFVAPEGLTDTDFKKCAK